MPEVDQNSRTLHQFAQDMRTAKYSPVTIEDRLEILRRLADHLGDTALLDATSEQLRGFQEQFAHLAPATIDIYSRHVKALYAWAYKRRLIGRDPAEEMIVPKVPRTQPHPTSLEDLRLIFSVTRGALRMAYVLAAFAGLRRGEICRLHRRDLSLSTPEPTALVHGKGNKERIVPLLPPAVAELHASGLSRGWVVHLPDGRPYPPGRLSSESTRHLQSLGLSTTLHSMRATFATHVGRLTRDPMLVRDLLGHESVATTEIYMKTSLRDAHLRLAGWGEQGSTLLGQSRKTEDWTA